MSETPTNHGWQDLSLAPDVVWGCHGLRALVWSHEFGIQCGEIGNWPDGPRGSVSGYHGCAVRDWHVSHWMPLPAPPTNDKERQS